MGLTTRAGLFVVMLLLAGCETADSRFDKSFELATSGREKCLVAREAQEHFLRSGDRELLEKWRTKGAFQCLSVGMD